MFCAEQVGTGIQSMGSHAEYMLAAADSTMLLPDELPYEQAAPIFCAGYTVWSGLRWADPKPHETIAVLGIGGLGHLAVQFAKAAGFRGVKVKVGVGPVGVIEGVKEALGVAVGVSLAVGVMDGVSVGPAVAVMVCCVSTVVNDQG